MPIRPELRNFYSSLEWRAIRTRILARAGGVCERCAKPDRKQVWVARDGSGRWWPRGQKPDLPGRACLHLTTCVLTVAHLNHDHQDNRDDNLSALCQRCHLAHDQRFHYANRRRTEARRRNQQWLTTELEHAAAPGPAWGDRLMKCISIRQPWAWLIFHGKDVENRTWPTSYRGPLLIHASATMTLRDYAEAVAFVSERIGEELAMLIPPAKYLVRGALIGQVDLVDCIRSSDSPWFVGPVGHVYARAQLFDRPIPAVGQLGLFDLGGPA